MNNFKNTFKRVIITNSNNPSPHGGSYFVLWIFIYLVIAFLVSYLTVMTFKYLKTDCMDKKSWWRYIFSFCYKDVCKPQKFQIVDRINVKFNIPFGAAPSMAVTRTDNKVNIDNIPLANYADNVSSYKKDPSVEFNIDEQKEKPQVFHIANQDYTYQQAKCKCASYNAKLANYSQIVDAYNRGAEWCSYGWSQGQAAYFPTQKCTWLKKSDEEKKECGKPGINGGFFGNPNLRFGINCYGKKPKGKIIKKEDKVCNYCNTQDDYATKKMETDQIAPFNPDQWTQ